MTIPLVVIVIVVIVGLGSSSTPSGSASGGVLAPVSVAAPPRSDAPTVNRCAQVLSALPLRIQGKDVRQTVSDPPSPSIVAWGQPAIVLRCGVDKPPALRPGSSDLLPGIDGVFFYQRIQGDLNTFTSVDRAVYIEVQVPTGYVAGGVMAPIAAAIAKTLPAVCNAQALPGEKGVDQRTLCVNR